MRVNIILHSLHPPSSSITSSTTAKIIRTRHATRTIPFVTSRRSAFARFLLGHLRRATHSFSQIGSWPQCILLLSEFVQSFPFCRAIRSYDRVCVCKRSINSITFITWEDRTNVDLEADTSPSNGSLLITTRTKNRPKHLHGHEIRANALLILRLKYRK